MNFNCIKNEFKTELSLVNNVIEKSLKSNIELIDDIGKYIVLYSGKRIRPLITILFSKILNYNDDKSILMSSVIELIHTATLLHDDVVDLSEKRRGKFTINKVWGNKEAILVGDFLYTRSFQMMVSTGDMEVLKLMAKTTNIMSEGEVNQLIHKENLNITEKDYFNIIQAKTAELFSASAVVVPILSKMDIKTVNLAHTYGINLGIAYQLIDDMLDYSGSSDEFGKNVGDDIFSGTFTLPLIYIMSDDNMKKRIKNIISSGYSENNIFKIRDLVLHSNSLNYTLGLAKKHADIARNAILSIEKSKYTQMALSLIDFIIERKY